MPTPLERLKKIAQSRTPSVMKFKYESDVHHRLNRILLKGVIVEEAKLTPPTEDKELFDLLSSQLGERWDDATEQNINLASVENLWSNILNALVYQYEKVSGRCDATKRKTTDFIYKIKIDDKMLSEFVLQTFIRIKSKSWQDVEMKDRIALFEQFDSLRRAFGKRK